MDAETQAHWERLGFYRPIYAVAQCGFDKPPTPQEFEKLMTHFGVPPGKGPTLETWLRVCGSTNSLWQWMNYLPDVKHSLQSPLKQRRIKTRPLRKWLAAKVTPEDMAKYIHAFGEDVVRARNPQWVLRLEWEMGLRRALVWRKKLNLTYTNMLHTAAWACYYQFQDVFFPAVDEVIAEDYLHTADELVVLTRWVRNMRVRTKNRISRLAHSQGHQGCDGAPTLRGAKLHVGGYFRLGGAVRRLHRQAGAAAMNDKSLNRTVPQHKHATMGSMDGKWARLLKKTGFIGSPSVGVLFIGAGAVAALVFFLPRLGLVFGAGLAFLGAAIFILGREEPPEDEGDAPAEEKDWLEVVLTAPTIGMAMLLTSGLFLLAAFWCWFALLAGLVSIGVGIYSSRLSLREEERHRREEED